MRLKFTNNNYIRLFIICGIILTSIFLIGYMFNPDLFYTIFLGDRSDAFMDFFNSVSHAMGRNPYGVKAIYPPLCYMLYWILGKAMGTEAMEILTQNQSSQSALKTLSQPMIVYSIYFVVSLALFVYLSYCMVKGHKHEKILFLGLIAISVPFMFQFERANIIFISLLGTMAFFVWKDSQNRYLRELALVCLALSAAIKVYPAILGLVLLKEKKYKESVRLVVYGIVCFFLPFLFIRGGFSNIPLFIENLIYTSTDFSAELIGYRLNFSAVGSFLAEKFTDNPLMVEQIGEKISIGITVLSVFALPWLKKSWKTTLLLMCLLVGVPSMSYTYTSIFLVVPLIFFLNDIDNEKLKGVYFILFILIFFPLPFGWNGHLEIVDYYRYQRSFNTLQSSISILVLTLLLIKEGLCNFIHLSTQHTLKRKVFVLTGLLSFACLLSIGITLNYSQAMLDKKESALVIEKTLKKESISFNGKQYTGVYEGETVDNTPSGEGTFIFSKKDGGLKLFGKWKDKSLNGNLKIMYPDGSYQTAFCENGQVYGNIMSYSSDGQLTGSEWYYEGQKLSSIKQGAVEADLKDMKIFKPGVIKFQGEVIDTTQADTYVEVTVKSHSGQNYLVSYYNNAFGLENQIKSPNLKNGDKIMCYGVLNGKDTKSVLGVDLISAELTDIQEMNPEKPDNSYDDIMRYPYKYLGEATKSQGIIKDIIRDFESNSLTYIIEENGNSYALAIGVDKLFKSPYIMPDEEKKPIMERLEKSLPTVGETMSFAGIYKGNYIWESSAENEYKLKPYIYTSVEMDNGGEYIFE